MPARKQNPPTSQEEAEQAIFGSDLPELESTPDFQYDADGTLICNVPVEFTIWTPGDRSSGAVIVPNQPRTINPSMKFNFTKPVTPHALIMAAQFENEFFELLEKEGFTINPGARFLTDADKQAAQQEFLRNQGGKTYGASGTQPPAQQQQAPRAPQAPPQQQQENADEKSVRLAAVSLSLSKAGNNKGFIAYYTATKDGRPELKHISSVACFLPSAKNELKKYAGEIGVTLPTDVGVMAYFPADDDKALYVHYVKEQVPNGQNAVNKITRISRGYDKPTGSAGDAIPF